MSGTACSRFEKELADWLEESWDAPLKPVPASLEEHADRCPRCRRRLTSCRILLGAADCEPPAELADRVLDRVNRLPGSSPATTGSWVAVAASIVVVLGLVLLVGVRWGQSSVTIQLTLNAPQASSVSVVGDWNGWDQHADRLTDSDKDGVWEIVLELEPGREHMYQFVVDELKRTPDPLAVINVDDGFGGVNSVLHL